MADVYVPERWKAEHTAFTTGNNIFSKEVMEPVAATVIEELGAAEQRVKELERRVLIAERCVADACRFIGFPMHAKLSLDKAELDLIAEGMLPAQQQKDGE